MNSSWTDLGAYFDELWCEVKYREVLELELLAGNTRLVDVPTSTLEKEQS